MLKNSNSGAKRIRKEKSEWMPEFDPSAIKIVAGLGNPEATYDVTYHNAGFLAVDYLSSADSETQWRKEKNFSYFKSGKVVFLKPDVFMNESGEAIRSGLRYFKTKPENLILCHDDSDIEIGKYKLAFDRGPAGHRGVASVINHLKTNGFWRARIGVRSRRGKAGLPAGKRMKAGDFVLKKINPADREKMEATLADLKRKLFPTYQD